MHISCRLVLNFIICATVFGALGVPLQVLHDRAPPTPPVSPTGNTPSDPNIHWRHSVAICGTENSAYLTSDTEAAARLRQQLQGMSETELDGALEQLKSILRTQLPLHPGVHLPAVLITKMQSLDMPFSKNMVMEVIEEVEGEINTRRRKEALGRMDLTRLKGLLRKLHEQCLNLDIEHRHLTNPNPPRAQTQLPNSLNLEAPALDLLIKKFSASVLEHLLGEVSAMIHSKEVEARRKIPKAIRKI